MATKTLIKELLQLLQQGYSIDEAAIKLGISKKQSKIMAYTLASQGLIKIYQKNSKSCSCDTCPLRDYCILNPRKFFSRRRL